MVSIEFSTCRSGRIGGAAMSWTIGKGRFLVARGATGGNLRSLADQESISRDTQCAVVMETAPLEMREAEFALQFLVVAVDPPPQFGHVDKRLDGGVFRQGREPVFGWLRLALRPFEEQPFGSWQLCFIAFCGRGANARRGEARGHRVVGALAPRDFFPGGRRQALRQRFHLRGRVFGVAPQARRGASASTPRGRRQGFDAGPPDTRVRLHANRVGQPHACQPRAKRPVHAIARIRQNHARANAVLQRRLNLRQRVLRLGFELHVVGHMRLLAPRHLARPVFRQI
jgi:hypothetical protein